jgi:hypothetical protein
MSFALRHGEHDYPIGEVRFVIGRSEGCQLCLNDPMASRNHAALQVENGRVRLEDLQSRNGVFVNKDRVQTSLLLNHGDTIRIGSQEMVVIQRGGRERAETLVQKPVTSRLQAFGVLGSLADKALALGHGDEAERILGRQLDQFVVKAEKGEALTTEEFEKCVGYGLKIGVLTRKGKWLDYLFRMHAAEQRLMDADLVNELYSATPKMNDATPGQLRNYLEALEDKAASFGPGERFVYKRIEGLSSLIS